MQANKTFPVIALFCFLLSGCIDPFSIPADKSQEFNLVIEGIFTNDGNTQEIIISRPWNFEFPAFIPVTSCQVMVEDDQKQVISFSEGEKAGHYQATPSRSFVQVGKSYRLRVRTPNGKQYTSPFEKMMPCPKIDSVYYEVKTIPTATIGDEETGLQFYLNFKGNESMGRYFRWSLEETWEYHSTWTILAYINRENKYIFVPEDFSNYVCYKTEPIWNIYNLSTAGFTQNSYTKYPLHWVSNETQRLLYHYSLLIKQYSMTEGAYNFWENLRKNNKETVSLYGKQPAPSRSNIRNENDSTEIILGYFGVSAVDYKRIHIKDVPGLTFNKVTGYCLNLKKNMRLDSIPAYRPLYLYPHMKRDNTILWVWGDNECFFCNLQGGTTVRPSYMDNNK